MRKIGLSTSSLQKLLNDDKKAIEIAAKAGADAVDFWLRDDYCDNTFDYRREGSLYSKSEEEIIEYFTDIKKHAENCRVFICQTHGRGKGFINNKAEDDALVENARIDLLATKILGAPVCVMHNATSIFLGANPDPELMHKLSFDMFTRILPYAKEYNIKLATETFGDAVRYNSVDFFGDINEFMKAYNDIKAIEEYKDYFTTCVDTGHSNKAMRFGNPTSADVIRKIGSDISVLHLDDNDTLIDQHKPPMTGSIDWSDVMKALDEVGYSGVYNMELNLNCFGNELMFETAEFAVKIMRNLLKNYYRE